MKIKIFFWLFLIIHFSCSDKSSSTRIKGNIPNLPDGILYLYKDVYNNRIDSVQTKNGQFTIEHNWSANETYPFVYLGIDHVDSKGILRAFSFKTNARFKGSAYNSQFFLSDSLISLDGEFTEFKQDGVELPEKVKIVTMPKIKAGYQTNALFNSDGDMFTNISKNTYEKIEAKIKQYPNSYHLLYQINNNRNSFTATQNQDFLSLFKGRIVASEIFEKLKTYNKKRFDRKQIKLPLLLNNKDEKTEILNTKYKKHVVVFWASWCGPCRQEIPELKKMHLQHKKNIEFVSISIDAKEKAWKKALEQENMSWKQLFVNEESVNYEQIEIFFQLSSSIPYMVLLDDNMNVIRSSVGLMTGIELDKFISE
ncbi:AhpC/TSA family protein [Flavobacterium tiangeerense]|uniref:AhpC/TSA family protein n=1 Tax=Flavobacterium tiangeerense TaxID=459471 RepID=UPI0011A22596|nr:AhpC/TSA family protein [Flavobacterium tiangeerense]